MSITTNKSVAVVAQSGGPTAVINTELAYIIREMRKAGVEVYGSRNGIRGILNGELYDLNLGDMELAKLARTPGAALGSCRYKVTDDDIHRITRYLDSFVDYFLYIGGNDSADTTQKL